MPAACDWEGAAVTSRASSSLASLGRPVLAHPINRFIERGPQPATAPRFAFTSTRALCKIPAAGSGARRGVALYQSRHKRRAPAGGGGRWRRRRCRRVLLGVTRRAQAGRGRLRREASVSSVLDHRVLARVAPRKHGSTEHRPEGLDSGHGRRFAAAYCRRKKTGIETGQALSRSGFLGPPGASV